MAVKVKKKRDTRPAKLTEKQRVFIAEFLTNGHHPVEAAAKAGYAKPEVEGSRLRDPNKCPLVVAEIERALRKIESASTVSAQDLLARIHFIINFDPTRHLRPSDDPKAPGFMCTPEEFRALPPEVGRLVQAAVFKRREKLNPEGQVIAAHTLVYLQLMSKDNALKLAAKFQLGDTLNVQGAVTFNWADLHRKVPRALPEHATVEDDPVERELAEAEAAAARAQRGPTVHVNGTNGSGAKR